MSKNHNSGRHRFCTRMWQGSLLLGAATLLLAACAEDGYDDSERFESSVKNTTLTSPDAQSITITPSADGKTQTITWPVVQGAGGYLFSFYDTSDLDQPIVKDSLIDGCSVSVKREEDMNYRIDLRTMGNAKTGNTEAASTTQLLFSTFTEAYAAIPAGTDLYQYFQDSPVPDSDENVYYDLEPGASYTLSNVLDFSNHNIVLRTTSKTNYATIVYGEGGSIEYCGGLSLKYLRINSSASSKPVLAFSATPAEGILDAEHNNHNQITEPTTIQNCEIVGVKRQLLYDNKVKYCLKTFYMENSLVHLESDSQMGTSAVFMIYDGGGFINDFTMENSTMWNSGENQQYMIRYANAGRCDRAGYTSNSINFINCTIYNIAHSNQMANHSGFDGRATSNYEIRNNIFAECGNGAVPRRITGRINNAAVNNFDRNTYWFDGKPETEGAPISVEGATSTYDQSGTALQTDPAFVDAANGNFTPQGAEQLQFKTGDSRWLP